MTPEKKKGKAIQVNVGTKNPAKIRAVKKALAGLGWKAVVVPNKTDSGVSAQPFGIKETVRGAKNRAKAAFEKSTCDFGLGMEAGLFEVEKNRWMDIGACTVFDGTDFSLGFTPAFEVPQKMVDWMKTHASEMGPAFEALYGGEKNIGQKKGAIGLLTRGKYERSRLWENAVIMALVPVLNKDKYP